MKLPRWLLWSMLSLSVLAVLGAGAWWVTWPERTARAFVRLEIESPDEAASSFFSSALRHMFDGQPPAISAEEAAEQNNMPIEEVRRIIAEQQEYERERAIKYPPEHIQPRPRSLLDLLKGRQVFEREIAESAREYVTVERATIVDIGFVIESEDISMLWETSAARW
jgi:hypothetical protein